MPTSPQTSNRHLLYAAASAVVVLSGLYLIFANGRQGNVPGIVVASVQVCAGIVLLWQALRSRSRDRDRDR